MSTRSAVNVTTFVSFNTFIYNYRFILIVYMKPKLLKLLRNFEINIFSLCAQAHKRYRVIGAFVRMCVCLFICL